MSGPVDLVDAPVSPASGRPAPPEVEVGDDREAMVGSRPVRRALPRRGRRTVGAWCFADHMGPADISETGGVDIAPHPHIGLQTVTWLIDGEVLHRDSLGSEQVIRPGQLNLMTAGEGVAHSEESTGAFRGSLHGVQLWVALPDGTRHGDSAFAHHADLPHVELDGAVVTVLVGTLGDATSPARHDTPLMGSDVVLPAGGRATVPVEGARGGHLRPGPGNDWQAGGARFGRVASALPRLDAPPLPWLSLSRGVERPNVYLLTVEWERLEDHTEGFRGSPQYERWRELLHHFYDPFPTVEHFTPVDL
jgi:redox-sensitive bicupin YhaK (pirin superfamily)/heme-degrading monooxygenase HmoA